MKRKRESPVQKRRWCFTLWDTGSPHIVEEPVRLADITPPPDYLVWQREISPTTGNKHIQGYVVFSKKKTASGAKTWLGDNTAHVEAAMGSDLQAANYCKKDESRDPEEGSGPFERGAMPTGGRGW